MSALWLLLKNLIYLAVVPGLVIGWLPLRVFERYPQWPPLATWAWPHYAGAALFALAAAAYLHCQWLFATRGQGTPAPFDPPRKFVRRGLYKWVRNPMYLATLALIGAEALFLRSWHIAVYFVCLACALHVFVMLWEEEHLRRNFGAMYEDYRREVRRWLPRKPRPTPQTVPPVPAKEH
jgi:protein-S-isoprenylcysteine O-methyltransferase Ste14